MLNNTNAKIKRFKRRINSTIKYNTEEVLGLYYPESRKLVQNLNCKGGTVIHIVYPEWFKNHTLD